MTDREWTVIIDTARPAARVFLTKGDTVIEREWMADHTLSRRLLTEFEDSLRQLKITGRAVRRVAVHVGPGHYSAVRTGIVIAQMLAIAWDLELVPVSGTDAAELQAAAAAGPPVAALRPQYVQLG